MASIEKTVDASGQVVYKVQASAGRGRRVKRSWRPEPGWSARTVERELNKFAADLENQLAAGDVITRQEDIERQRLAEMERAKLKTFRQYAEGVFMPTKEATFSENARASYAMFFDKHIFPVLGDQHLEEITPAMLTKLLLDFQKSGRIRIVKDKDDPNKKKIEKCPMSHASTVKLYNILNGVFQMAFLDDSIPANPMLRVSRPKPRKGEQAKPEQEKAYTVAELRRILQCLENEPLKWRVFINLIADTGIRRGEACGLQWQDIDFPAAAITIRRNLQYTAAAGVYETSPKNGRARVVDVGPDVLDLLRELQQDQAKSCISRWVFTQDGTPDPMHPTSPTGYFTEFGKRYGVADFHSHKLRHTSASLAITNGADVVSVSERLGHSDTAVTLRMYAHANEESIRRAGQIVRDALKREAE